MGGEKGLTNDDDRESVRDEDIESDSVMRRNIDSSTNPYQT